MSNLLSEVPEAATFLNDVIKNAEQYKLYPGEHFASFLGGIIATSEEDLQHDRITVEALASVAEQINSAPLWNLAEHDPLIQPIGRSLAARLFHAPVSDVYFVAAVTGVYDAARLPRFADLGIDASKLHLPEDEALDSPGAPQVQLAIGRADLDEEALRQLMSSRPALVDNTISDRTRKAADPLAIIELAVTAWLLTSNPFSDAFLRKFGEKAAEQVSEFFGWVKGKVIPAVQRHQNSRVLLEFTIVEQDCRVEFVIDSKDSETLNLAVDSLPSAARSARALVMRLSDLEPKKLVYGFEERAKRWMPLHAATTKAGVISDRPVLVAVERYGSLSISATVGQRKHRLRGDPAGESQEPAKGPGAAKNELATTKMKKKKARG